MKGTKMKNLNIAGTFREYMESIATEIKRLLTIQPNENEYSVEVQDTDWSKAQDGSIQGLAIVFADEDNTGSHFSIAEFEFEKAKHKSLLLNRLIEVRLADAIGSLKNIYDRYGSIIKKLEGNKK